MIVLTHKLRNPLGVPEHELAQTRHDAADHIEAQAERIRVLREALKKIAQFDSYEPAGPAANTARAALEATK